MDTEKGNSDVVVTLEHPSFNTFSYRCAEVAVQASIPAAFERAKLEEEVRVEVAKIDAEQTALSQQHPRIEAKIAAAETLENASEKEDAEAERDALQSKIDALSAKRAEASGVLAADWL